MNRKAIIIPNLLVLSCALVLYHRSFFAGHFTRIGLLLVFASLLPLLFGLFQGIRSRVYMAVAALLNTALFALYAYIFCGTTYMLIKNGMANVTVYALIVTVWVFAVLTAVKGRYAAVIFSIILIGCAVVWFNFRMSMQLAANLNVAMYGIIAAVGALNIYSMCSSFCARKLLRQAGN